MPKRCQGEVYNYKLSKLAAGKREKFPIVFPVNRNSQLAFKQKRLKHLILIG